MYLTKHGRRAVAMVPAAVAELMEEIEDLVDSAAVAQALAESHAGRDEPRPFVRQTHRRTS